MKKIISVLLSAAILASSAIATSVSASSDNDELQIFTMQTQEKSDYGFNDYKFVDKNGNPVFEQNKEDFIPSGKTVNSFSALPESYDARNEGYVTDAKYQGDSGNCWAYSVISVIESERIKKGNDSIENADYSEAHLAWFTGRPRTENTEDPTHGDGYNLESPFLSGGNWLMASGTLARWSGIANESDYPYHSNDLSLMTGYSEDCRYDTSSGAVINSSEVMLDIDDVKLWIYNHGSVTAAIYYNDKYLNENNTSYYFNGNSSSNHQITVIGWDDNYSSEKFNSDVNPGNNGAWLCKNSWSKYWGNEGCFWISYYDCGINSFAGFTSKEINENSNNYTYNGTNYESFTSDDRRVLSANVFRAKGCEKLTSVSIYTVTEGTDVTVTIYKDIQENYKYPNQGTLAITFDTFIAREGYHTIELPESVQLAPDSIFSVVIETKDQNGITHIPLEYNSSGITYTAGAGESYLNIGGYTKTWVDNTTRGWGNFHIQAFTEDCHSYVNETVKSTCQTPGAERVVCEFCGDILSEITYAKGDHIYGEWSEFEPDEHGTNTSNKICTECGNTITRIDKPGKTVNIAEFFEIIFYLISKLFSVR